ncbi:2-hydroxyglutaryl-CoA dehydratase, D-component [Clostridium homopropionicum DSM 5847]|uniref:2-hydroxyglutaryl-CoA dehydratase, D-component n=1 Tax=Clostridium homopropionicum DSM 5847 TaxID=1121318 RepID=A0A0L6Z7W0_9CLOT|nr:acyl-CoA dehydratase activase-related protein [Clostridium homopropionicum]KOA18883.1 2-hydroxyglutaryl-CoA dehydratase, D-component [Clostridium homopropionicum DSM 5847]SFG45721.1 Predicted nucleotide-binding protein, sugar kinase/HSP70/actin superfamily [Clostridium homopropionicum]
MKITFPHMGNVYIAAKIFFDGMGIDYVIPPMNNKAALEIGVEHSPEEMCLPFKIMIGNFVQSIEQGADTILLVGSCGPCRFGEYSELQMKILKKLGHDLQFIVMDYVKDIGKSEFMNRLGILTSGSKKSGREKVMASLRAIKAINLIDKIEERAHYLAGYEVNRGECKKLLNKCKRDVFETDNPVEAIRILEAYRKNIEKVKIDKNKKPVKVAVIGEIYTVIDPFSNLNIEDKLMDYGVCSKRKLTPSWWVKDAAMKVLNLNSIDIRRASKEYLPYYIGGHARECIGEAMIAHKQNLDGAIQIFPMGCMPEIITKAILPSISRDKDFPIMSLVVDEMTGEGGYVTRIEAFLDLLERRQENVSHGC